MKYLSPSCAHKHTTEQSSSHSLNVHDHTGVFPLKPCKTRHQLCEADSGRNEQKCEHMSNLAKSASGARASCLAGELSRLRCLAPFSPLSPAMKGPMTALFFFPVCHRFCQHHVPTLRLKLPNKKISLDRIKDEICGNNLLC